MRRISDLKSRRWRDGDGLHKRMMELLGGTESRGLDSKGNSSLAFLAHVMVGDGGNDKSLRWRDGGQDVIRTAENDAVFEVRRKG